MENDNQNLINILKQEIKLERRPFLRISKELGIDEGEAISRIEALIKTGFIRYMGISIEPTGMGYNSAALVCWKVSGDRIEEIGQAFSALSEVTHCYERETPPEWPYNLFTMVHGKNEDHLDEFILKYSEKFSLNDYRVYKTVKRLKKTTMYNNAEDAGKS